MKKTLPENDSLFHAIEQHDLQETKKALAEGLDPNTAQTKWPYYTPLQAAINELEEGGPLETLNILLDHGADVNGWDKNKDSTPLLMAVFRHQYLAVKLLLEKGADPNVRGGEGDSALRWCAEKEDIEMAQLLLKYGAEKTIDEWGGFQGYTALGLAANHLHLEMIQILLNAGAKPEAEDEDGKLAVSRLPLRTKVNEVECDRAKILLTQSFS